MEGQTVVCPKVDNIDCPNDNESNLFLGPIPTYISLTSSSLSCIGASIIVLTYILFKELRTNTRSIITYLAIADFFTGFGYIIGGSNYLVHSQESPGTSCIIFDNICAIQSYITTWSQLTSYIWNSILAYYLFMTISFGKYNLVNRLIPFYHIIAWGIPITVALPLMCTGYLGYSPYAASNWCFIKDAMYQTGVGSQTEVIIAILFAGKLPEIICYIFLITFYTLTKCFIWKIKRRLNRESDSFLLKQAIQRVDNRLVLIPLVFVLLRMWGTMQFFFTIIISRNSDSGCISHLKHLIHFSLGIMEAIGDGGQGWANALLFVFLNSKTRNLILCKVFNTCERYSQCCCHRDKSVVVMDDPSTISKMKSSVVDSVSTGLHEIVGESYDVSTPLL